MEAQPVPWTWLDLLRAVAFALGIVAACAVLVGGGYAALRFAEQRHLLEAGWLGQHLGPVRPYAAGILVLLVGGVLYGAALLGIRRYSIQKYRLPWSALYLRHVGWMRYLAMPALYIPMQFGTVLILTVQARASGHAMDNPQRDIIAGIAHHHWFNYVAVFLVAAVIAPIAEEIVFRGFFYRLLRKRLPTWAAVPISAAVFAVLHGIPVLIPMLFYLGVVFALVVEHTRSLYCSIILHAVQNAISLLVLFVTMTALEAGAPTTHVATPPESGFFQLLGCVV
jgi:membrane protease YdiL (CAAX protease family)